MSKPAVAHITTARALSGNIAENAPRQITVVSASGGTVSMGFNSQANQDIWLAQNAFWLDEVTSNRK